MPLLSCPETIQPGLEVSNSHVSEHAGDNALCYICLHYRVDFITKILFRLLCLQHLNMGVTYTTDFLKYKKLGLTNLFSKTKN